jgi:plasmid stabilization system protein ParE
MPALGKVRHEHEGLRSYSLGSHIVFYLHGADTLFVVRVLHNRQDVSQFDWESLIDDEGKTT